ncbi:MAG: hypothetical protein ABJQ63_18275, partial [Lentilitoribacter sp.]
RNHLYPTTGSGAALNGQSHASSRLPPGSTEPKHPQGATSVAIARPATRSESSARRAIAQLAAG